MLVTWAWAGSRDATTASVRRMSSVVESPVVGTVWKIQMTVGDVVAKGDDIMILESMKMEIPIESEVAGTIITITVAEGDQVAEGDALATIG